MCHWLRAEGKFWNALVRADAEIAEKVREGGCRHCGGRLHRADYPRKPRGELGEVEEAFCRRPSFCCSQCRRRVTPPSVRFLGRKVYVGQLVIAACLCWQAVRGAVGKRVGIVPRKTVRRWMAWWKGTVPETSFWKAARGFFMPPVDVGELPRSLVERFGQSIEALGRALGFVSPLTTRSARCARVEVFRAEDGAW